MPELLAFVALDAAEGRAEALDAAEGRAEEGTLGVAHGGQVEGSQQAAAG